jgi:hypothetical protein
MASDQADDCWRFGRACNGRPDARRQGLIWSVGRRGGSPPNQPEPPPTVFQDRGGVIDAKAVNAGLALRNELSSSDPISAAAGVHNPNRLAVEHAARWPGPGTPDTMSTKPAKSPFAASATDRQWRRAGRERVSRGSRPRLSDSHRRCFIMRAGGRFRCRYWCLRRD